MGGTAALIGPSDPPDGVARRWRTPDLDQSSDDDRACGAAVTHVDHVASRMEIYCKEGRLAEDAGKKRCRLSLVHAHS